MLYEKRFGLLQKETEEEALTFITAIKTVSRPLDSMTPVLEFGTAKVIPVSPREECSHLLIFNT